ncbi:MAG: hypothetical protein GC153_03695 [Alphaproteobacteria bacterium]|nr:hypothetical protein [Alphaproteobacteria bacterium]
MGNEAGYREMALLESLKDRLRPQADLAGGREAPVAPKLALEARSLAERILGRRAPRLLKALGGRDDMAPPDPAKTLFPAEESVPGDARQPLGGALQMSAAAIDRRAHEVAGGARRLAATLARRMEGETTLVALAFRFLIAMVWLALAAALFWTARVGAEAWMGPIAGVDRADAARLAWAFALSGAAGVLGAFLIAWTVFLTGAGDNRRVRDAAGALGEKAAEIARDFDSELGRLRGLMDRNDKNPAAAVDFLSRTHLVALEAAVFFRSIGFLAERDGELDEFRDFIARRAPRAAPSNAFLPGFVAGAILGAAAILLISPAAPPEFAHMRLPLERYPLLLAALVGGAFVYALTRLAVAASARIFVASAEREAYAAALDAFRGGYVAQKAPRIESVIQRIEDALDVYKARLAPAAKKNAAAPREDDIPAWRKPPEPPRFVETGFQAAPKTFLADPPAAPEGRSRKLFSGRGPEAKRSLERLKKPDGA